MRKLLYAFVFASILLLAGFTSFASFDEPGDGGTVPDEEYALWLPVVELAYRYTGDLSNLPDDCPYRAVAFTPEDGAVFQYGDIITFTWTLVDRNGYVVPEDPNGKVSNMWHLEGRPLYSIGRETTVYSADWLGNGRWEWGVSVTCFAEGWDDPHGIPEMRYFTLVNGPD